MSTESIILIAAIITTAVAMSTFFYRMFSGMKRDMRDMKSDLERQIKEETSKIWKSIGELSGRVDKLSDRVNQLSNDVSQIKAILGNIGFVVKESEVSYKGDQGATGSKKSG